MVGLEPRFTADGRVGTEEPPQRDAFAGIMHIKPVASAQNQRMPDRNMNVAHVIDFIGNFAQAQVHLRQKRPVASFIHIFKLLHLDQHFVEAMETDCWRTTVEGKRVLLELAHEVHQPQPGGMEFHLAGRVAGPVASFFGQYQVSCHKFIVAPLQTLGQTYRRKTGAICPQIWTNGRDRVVSDTAAQNESVRVVRENAQRDYLGVHPAQRYQ